MIASASTFAFQGAAGAFSHQAGQLFASDRKISASFIPCTTFEELFEMVVSGAARYGVVPLENSSVGSIVANYDLLWSQPVSLIGEVLMPIHHNLIGLPGSDVSQIRQVLSHPVALDQCRRFFSRMTHLKPVAHFDTSGAVLHVRETDDSTIAAIAGEFAASEHGLAILERNIEDHEYNSTRFGIISTGSDVSYPDPPYKISVAVELEHKPGMLAELLSRIAELQINLTKIESRPIPETPWHYRFFIDMELDRTPDVPIEQLLGTCCQSHKILGSYRPWRSAEKMAGGREST